MKTLLPLLILVFGFSVFGQTKPKTKPNSVNPQINTQPSEIDIKIAELKKIRDYANQELNALRTKYSDEYPKIKETLAKIEAIDKEIALLEEVKNKFPIKVAKGNVVDIVREEQIEKLLMQKVLLERERQKLLAEYQPTANEIKEIDKRIKTIEQEISNLRNDFYLTPQNLPSDSTFLLKLIIIQNQRIIELLEKRKQ